jgi:hypothetical protein
VGKKSSQSDSEPPKPDVRPSAHPVWNGLEIPARPEPLLPPGRHVRNLPFQDGKPNKDVPSLYGGCVGPVHNLTFKDGMYQLAQTFVSGGGFGGDWTSDGTASMAFTVWLSRWTSQQLPDGLMVMKKGGGKKGKLTFVSRVAECNSSDDFKPGDYVSAR